MKKFLSSLLVLGFFLLLPSRVLATTYTDEHAYLPYNNGTSSFQNVTVATGDATIICPSSDNSGSFLGDSCCTFRYGEYNETGFMINNVDISRGATSDEWSLGDTIGCYISGGTIYATVNGTPVENTSATVTLGTSYIHFYTNGTFTYSDVSPSPTISPVPTVGNPASGFISAVTDSETGLTGDNTVGSLTPAVPFLTFAVLFALGVYLLGRVLKGSSKGKGKI